MDIFKSNSLEFRRKFLVLAGAKIDIKDVDTDMDAGFIKMKAFKLKEDIRLFTDESMTTTLLAIKARQVIDFGATYDVFDGPEKHQLFSLQRKGLSSTFVRDTWFVLNNDGQKYAEISEVGDVALLHRYIGFLPIVGAVIEILFWFTKQKYELRLTDGGQLAGVIVRQKNPFIIKFTTHTENAERTVDPQILVAATAMLSVIDGSKN